MNKNFEIMDKLAQRISDEIIKQNTNISKLSKKIGIHASTLRKFLNRTNKSTNFKVLLKVSEALGTDLNHLIDFDKSVLEKRIIAAINELPEHLQIQEIEKLEALIRNQKDN